MNSPYKQYDETAPYGPGNPDYEYDGWVQRKLEEEEAAKREEKLDERAG